MYTPAQFRIEDAGEAHALMRAHPFAVLVTHGSEGLTATHLPTVLKVDTASPLGRVECHVARPNPQWKTFATEADALMIFQGPEAYIRPGWYPSKVEHGKAVPTWNYAVVHAYGRLRAIEDVAWLRNFVSRLTERHEGERAVPWKVTDAPADFIERQLGGIVGLEILVRRLDGKWKVSQNRPAPDRAGVVAGFRERGDPASGVMADLVAKADDPPPRPS